MNHKQISPLSPYLISSLSYFSYSHSSLSSLCWFLSSWQYPSAQGTSHDVISSILLHTKYVQHIHTYRFITTETIDMRSQTFVLSFSACCFIPTANILLLLQFNCSNVTNNTLINISFPDGETDQIRSRPPHCWGFWTTHLHTHTHTHTNKHTHTVGLLWMSDQLVAEAATCTTHNKQKKRISTTSSGFEPAIPAIEQPQT
jgi:hypothetical protein